MFRIGGAIAPVLTLCLTATPGAAEVVTYSDAPELILEEAVRLSPDQSGAVSRFLSEGMYFGAFYAAPGGEAFGWLRNAASLQGAEAVAKGICEARAGGDCVEIMRVLPQGFEGDRSAEGAVSLEVARFLRHENWTGAEAGTWRALAHNGLRHWGAVTNRTSQAEAEAGALEICNDTLSEDRDRPAREIGAAIDASGLAECRVVIAERVGG